MDQMCKMVTDLKRWLIKKGKDFVAPSFAVEETTDTAWVAIFKCGVDSNWFVIEEVLDIKSLHETTTEKDLFENHRTSPKLATDI